jgi:hypothetical protein
MTQDIASGGILQYNIGGRFGLPKKRRKREEFST